MSAESAVGTEIRQCQARDRPAVSYRPDTVRPMYKELPLADLASVSDDELVSMTGALRHGQLKRTVAGEDWAILTLGEGDQTAIVMVLIRVFATVAKDLLVPDTMVRVTGRVYRADDGILRIAASSVESAAD